jgi:hypothetical protein
VTEAELAAEVDRLLEARGQLLWHRCRDSRWCKGPKGWPDLAIIGQGLMLRELKGSETRMRLHQIAYGHRLERAGVDYGIWRPEDLESGRIVRELNEAG